MKSQAAEKKSVGPGLRAYRLATSLFATRSSKHLFPRRSAKMIIPSNNKIFGKRPSSTSVCSKFLYCCL